MKKTLEEYLAELRGYFSESNMDSFEELKEDLSQHVLDSIENGQTEEEAVQGLSSPKEIAHDLFEDRRLETAERASGDVVPEEEVSEIFIEKQRARAKKTVRKLGVFIKWMCLIILVGIGIYSLIYIGNEWYFEKNIARIPLILVLLSGAILSYSILPTKGENKKRKYVVSGGLVVLSLGILAEGLMNNTLFYTGVDYFHEITSDAREKISFSLYSDAAIDITTTEVGPDDPFSVMIDGNFKKKDISSFKSFDGKSTIDLQIDKKGLFDSFTRTQSSEVIVFIPKGMKLSDFQLDLSKGDLRLLDIEADSIDLYLKEGDIFGKDMSIKRGKIASEYGDVVIEASHLNGTIMNTFGKIIMTTNQGNLTTHTDDGHIILKKMTSESSKATTDSGKITIEDSQIDKLVTFGKAGQSIVTRVTGNITMKSDTGKIVAESSQGHLETTNKTGTTIVIDTFGTPSKVRSDSGFIKWIHDNINNVTFKAVSKSNEVRNEITTEMSGPVVIDIETNTGEIRLLSKVN